MCASYSQFGLYFWRISLYFRIDLDLKIVRIVWKKRDLSPGYTDLSSQCRGKRIHAGYGGPSVVEFLACGDLWNCKNTDLPSQALIYHYTWGLNLQTHPNEFFFSAYALSDCIRSNLTKVSGKIMQKWNDILIYQESTKYQALY